MLPHFPLGFAIGRNVSTAPVTEDEQKLVARDNAQPPSAPVKLSNAEQTHLAAVALQTFRQDPATAAAIIAKAINEAGKKELLAVLETNGEAPKVSRGAMLPPEKPVLTGDEGSVQAPTLGQVLRVAATKGLPFVAFGLFDNAIMITAGEQIDLMFGAKLGLSSMAAAGLGNTVADVVGINISHTIEQRFKRMKNLSPPMSPAQLALPVVRRAKWLGCAVGMATGCLLGLTPLLFMDMPPSQPRDGSPRPDQQQQPAM